MLTAGEVAGLVVAMFWAILVCFLAMVLVKLARLINETTKMVSEMSERVAPLLDDVSATVTETNRRLVTVDAITEDVKRVSGHVAQVSDLASTVFTGPLIKLSAFAYGVRQAIAARRSGGRSPARPVLRQGQAPAQGQRRNGARALRGGRRAR
ncbi:DUF948 domain-containing protein [Sinosporangium siamense]|uniref:DUF948 domain-containing protein n=1 Tax=Sinosporangium siamense TaxID=1367973 RepID=A0A919VAE0_9ACTN|nr:DUF948 domain-containing protein [Sinosporangium siamense]GII95312.1 hypothetical protein Ssi02_55430 [Sinosporangium siamense]